MRERRNDLRLSQRDLAERAGVSRPWLVAVEAGHPRAELAKLLTLLAELGLTLDLSSDEDADVGADTGQPALDLDALLAANDKSQRQSGRDMSEHRRDERSREEQADQ